MVLLYMILHGNILHDNNHTLYDINQLDIALHDV